MTCLIINRTRDKDRLHFQKTQLERLNLKYLRIEAVEGDALSDEIFHKYRDNWQRPLRITEVACTMSHKKCWDKVIELDEPCLILEDDAYLIEHIQELLDSLFTEQQFDLVSLESFGRDKILSKQTTSLPESYHLHKMLYDKGGAAAYILWPSGAQKMQAHLANHGLAPADAALGDCAALKRGQVNPAPVLQIGICDVYGIKPPIEIASTITSGHVRPKPKTFSELLTFKTRRILGQIKLLFRVHVRCLISPNFRKLFVPANVEHFKDGPLK